MSHKFRKGLSKTKFRYWTWVTTEVRQGQANTSVPKFRLLYRDATSAKNRLTMGNNLHTKSQPVHDYGKILVDLDLLTPRGVKYRTTLDVKPVKNLIRLYPNVYYVFERSAIKSAKDEKYCAVVELSIGTQDDANLFHFLQGW